MNYRRPRCHHRLRRRHRRRRYKNIDASVAGCDGCDTRSSCAVVAANGVIAGFAPDSRYVA
jgi:hypothetical protein